MNFIPDFIFCKDTDGVYCGGVVRGRGVMGADDERGSALFLTNTSSYTSTILTASNGITGFSADKFNINTAAFNGTGGFANALGGGTFSMGTNGNDLNLVFTAAGPGPGPSGVPEPGIWAAAALLVGAAGFLRWRKRAKVS